MQITYENLNPKLSNDIKSNKESLVQHELKKATTETLGHVK